MLLKNQWVNEEIKMEIQKHLKTNDNENKTIQNLWDSGKVVLSRKIHSNTDLSQKRRKISNRQLNPHLNELEKKNKQNLNQQKEGNHKDSRGNQ